MTKLREVLRLMRKRATEGHLSVARQAFESLLIWVSTGNGPGFYQMAGLWNKDIPLSDKLNHLGQRGYLSRLEGLNPGEYRKISQHKIAEKAYLSLLGFPTPSFLGFYHPAYGRGRAGERLRTSQDVVDLISGGGHSRVCLKHMEGWGGQGVQIVDLVGSGERVLMRPLGTELSLMPEQVLKAGGGEAFGGLLIEEYLRQHSTINTINPSSVNTIRIWVLQKYADRAETVVAYLRIGRQGSIVDNRSQGGIVAPIHLETGVLGEAIDAVPSRESFSAHPDHGARIAGITVPYWDAVKEMAEECLNCFPEIRFVGMDVAISPDGPMIIELNVSPDKEGASRLGVPTSRILRSLD